MACINMPPAFHAHALERASKYEFKANEGTVTHLQQLDPIFRPKVKLVSLIVILTSIDAHLDIAV